MVGPYLSLRARFSSEHFLQRPQKLKGYFISSLEGATYPAAPIENFSGENVKICTFHGLCLIPRKLRKNGEGKRMGKVYISAFRTFK